MVLSMPDQATSPRRLGGADRATGALRFAGDLILEDALEAALVSLDCGRAEVRSIDPARALQVDGVVGVFTADDVGGRELPRFGPRFADRPVIVSDETRFHGEPVAVVLATSRRAARAGAAVVDVEYQELPGVFSIDDALDPASPLVVDPSERVDDPFRESNIRQQWEWGWGDVDAAQAHLVLENSYEFPMVTHFSIEPHVFAAAPDAGGLAVWSAIQHPYFLQRTLADVFSLPISKVRVHAPDPGGGFGGKGYPKYEPLVAALAMKLGRPVRLALSLEETFQAVRRTNARLTLRTGFTEEGRLVFVDATDDFLMGAYADIAPRVISKASYLAAGPYRVGAVRSRVRALMSHTTPSTAFRGFGAPQMTWAIESSMDAAARALAIDPIEMRLRNLAAPGEEIVPGDRPADGDWRQVVHIAAEAVGWGQPLPPGRGRGLAVGIKASATAGASYCVLRLLYDGSVSLIAGTFLRSISRSS